MVARINRHSLVLHACPFFCVCNPNFVDSFGLFRWAGHDEEGDDRSRDRDEADETRDIVNPYRRTSWAYHLGRKSEESDGQECEEYVNDSGLVFHLKY